MKINLKDKLNKTVGGLSVYEINKALSCFDSKQMKQFNNGTLPEGEVDGLLRRLEKIGED